MYIAWTPSPSAAQFARRAHLADESATTRMIDALYKQREGKLESAHPLHASRSTRMLGTLSLSRSRASLASSGGSASGMTGDDDGVESPGHARRHLGRGIGDAGPWSLSASTSLPFSPVAARWVQRPHDGGSRLNGSRIRTPDDGLGRLRAFESLHERRPSSAAALAGIGAARPFSSSSAHLASRMHPLGPRGARGPSRQGTALHQHTRAPGQPFSRDAWGS